MVTIIVGSFAKIRIALRGSYRVDPADTVDVALRRASLSPCLNSLIHEGKQPTRPLPFWGILNEVLEADFEFSGPAPLVAKGIQLVFRNEIHEVHPTRILTFAQAIDIALPFQCHSEGAEIWDVGLGFLVKATDKIPERSGVYQVSLVPELFEIAPVGQIRFPPLNTVGECLLALNGALYGSEASLLLTANGISLAQELTIAAAALRGPLRLKVYGLLGGGKPTISPLNCPTNCKNFWLKREFPKR